MRHRTRMDRVIAGLGAFLLSGCYTYTPVRTAPVGSEVRAHLPVETRVAGGAATTETIPVEGRVITFGDSLLIETESHSQVGNFARFNTVDTLRLDPGQLASVELKEFSRGKTLAFTGVVLAGVGLIAAGIVSITGGSQGGEPGGGNTGTSVTVSGLVGLLRALGGS